MFSLRHSPRRALSATLAGALSLATLLAAPLQAAEVRGTYRCEMSDAENSYGWISKVIYIRQFADGSVKVADPVVQHFEGAPIPARVLRDDGNRLIVKWSLKNARADSGVSISDMDYRASITRSGGAIELRTIPRHFDRGIRSGGRCALDRG